MTKPEYRAPTKHAYINDALIRCLRDTGDGDYIAARLAMRHRLVPQFLWSAEQAIEKYLKGILTLHRVSAVKVGHDIRMALRLIDERLGFAIPLTPPQQEVFELIADWNADRYFLGHSGVMGHELHYLDQLVWRMRQYCQPLDVVHYADEPSRSLLEQNVKSIEKRALTNPAEGRLAGGRLEAMLSGKSDPARPALVWKNLMFSTSTRKQVLRRNYMQSNNAPLWLRPELLDDLAVLLFMPKDAKDAYRQLALQRGANE